MKNLLDLSIQQQKLRIVSDYLKNSTFHIIHFTSAKTYLLNTQSLQKLTFGSFFFERTAIKRSNC